MSSITQINMNDIPSTVKLFTKGAKTKKIYLKGEPQVAIEEFEKFITSFNLPYDEYITLAKSTSEELKILGESGRKMKNISVFIYKQNNLIKEQSIGDRGMLGIACYGSFLIEFDEPITIQSSRSSYIYYEEYSPIQLKPMPKIDKLIDSSSFENVSTKLQEINNLLKIGSDNLKTIMDANNLMYEPTDNFSTLVKKLNNEPINFLLEGTKVRDILKKHMESNVYAPDPGALYYTLDFTNEVKSTWKNLNEDLSLKQDKSILLYSEDKTSERYPTISYHIYSREKIYANKNSSYLFNFGINYFQDINFNNFYGNYIEDASHFFENVNNPNASVPAINLTNFNNINLDNLIDISYMFSSCAINTDTYLKITNKIKKINNFYSYKDTYSIRGTLTLNYVDNISKKIAENIIKETNDDYLKLGTLVTQ